MPGKRTGTPRRSNSRGSNRKIRSSLKKRHPQRRAGHLPGSKMPKMRKARTVGNLTLHRASRHIPSGHAGRTDAIVAKVAMAIVNPSSCPNFRTRPEACDSSLTTTALLHAFSDENNTLVAGTYGDVLPLGSSAYVQFRDPLRCLIKSYPNSAHSYFEYDGVFDIDNSSILDISDYVVNPISPLMFKATTTVQPHGPNMFLGSLSNAPGMRFFWMDRATHVEIVIANALSNDVVSVYLASAGNTLDDEITQLTCASGTNVLQFHIGNANDNTGTPRATNWDCGYYGFVYNPVGASANRNVMQFTIVAGATINIGGTDHVLPVGDVFSHLALPGVESHLAALTKIRINAASLMISPAASMLNLSGFVFGGQLQEPLAWFSQLKPEVLTSSGSSDDFLYGKRPFTSGMYAYLKPTAASDFAWQTIATRNQKNKIEGLTYPLNVTTPLANKSFNLFTVRTSNNNLVGNAAPSNEIELTQFYSIEWTPTQDQWYEIHLAPYRYNQFNDALEAVRLLPVFYDNPFHLKDLANYLRGAFKANRTAIASTLSALFPAYSVPIQGASAVAGFLMD